LQEKQNQRRRIGTDAEQELVEAIQRDEIENASAFAVEFAGKHGLNPTTVRSRISRLRRQLGKAARPPTLEEFVQSLSAKPRRSSRAASTAGRGDEERDVEVAAAALVRYEKDAAFRAAVDRRRPEVEKLFETLEELRTAAAALGEGERADIIRLLLPLVRR
jgi:hypothetical protein